MKREAKRQSGRYVGRRIRLFDIGAVLGFLGLFLTAFEASAQGEERYVISGVAIQGNQRIDTAAIKQQLHATSGQVTSDQISDDIKSLYNTGFFDRVSVSAVQGSEGTILQYSLVEKPLVRKVFIKGNKEVKEDELADVIKFDNKRFLDKTKIDLVVKKAVTYYQQEGYYDAALDYSVASVGDNQVDLTFNVTEGKRYRVREVFVRGAQSLDEDDMLSKLQSREYKWYSSWLFGTGRVNAEMLEADKQVLRQYLLDNGHVDGTVGDAYVEKKEDGLYVYFDVTEGPEYKVGRVSVSGDLIDNNRDETLDGIKSEAGDTFNASEVRSDIFTISDKFSDKGYAFANVVPNTNVKRADGVVDLEFNVSKGQLVKVNRINISGNQKTYDNVIRRTLKIGEQQTYSGSKVKRSQLLLERLGYFEEVNIATEPTSDPSKVDLNVNVREGSTGSFSAGAGYATSDGVLFNTRISENNLFGTGRRVNLNLDFGTLRNNQVLSFDDPRVADSYLSAGVDIYRTDRSFIDFDRELLGAGGSIGYPGEELLGLWAQDVQFALKYEFNQIDISNLDDDVAELVRDSEGESTASSVTPTITRNTINNPLNPTKGSRQVLSWEIAGLGGDEDYTLLEFRNSWYYPILQGTWGEITFADRTTFGYGESNTDDPFPLFRRFFPGGINSVRGYKNRSLGPKDERDNLYGGSKQLINNAELIFPLINSAGVRGVLFYDMGEAFDDDESIDIGDLRRSWGYGIRWASPLGPIRVEFGYPIGREQGEKGMVPMFSFGAPL